MRSHGVNIPTSAPSHLPSGSAKAVKLSGPVVNPNSAHFHAALHACQSLQPAETQLAG
jgi:hypothetical protein